MPPILCKVIGAEVIEPRPVGARPRHRGLTLIELLCALCINAALLAGAIPALSTIRHVQALHAAVAELETDIQLARSTALTSDRSVRLSLQHEEQGGACYVIHTGSAGACRCDTAGHARCSGSARAVRVQPLPKLAGIRMHSASNNIVFDAGKGTVTPTATFVIADSTGRTVHQVVNILGRTRSCSPNGVDGYRRCT